MKWTLGLLQVAFFGITPGFVWWAVYGFWTADPLWALIASVMALIAIVGGLICSFGRAAWLDELIADPTTAIDDESKLREIAALLRRT